MTDPVGPRRVLRLTCELALVDELRAYDDGLQVEVIEVHELASLESFSEQVLAELVVTGTLAAVHRFLAWLRAKGADPRLSESDDSERTDADPSVER
jgi:hypothetical protein